MASRVVHAALKLLASLRLTVVLLALVMLSIFVDSIAQNRHGAVVNPETNTQGGPG